LISIRRLRIGLKAVKSPNDLLRSQAGTEVSGPLGAIRQAAGGLGDHPPGALDVVARSVELADREADHVAAAQPVLGEVDPAAVVERVQEAVLQAIKQRLVGQRRRPIAERQQREAWRRGQLEVRLDADPFGELGGPGMWSRSIGGRRFTPLQRITNLSLNARRRRPGGARR
jgi:hypothetical protein